MLFRSPKPQNPTVIADRVNNIFLINMGNCCAGVQKLEHAGEGLEKKSSEMKITTKGKS